MKDITPLLLGILLVAGIYILPNALAMFAGSHTMEANVSTTQAQKNPKSLDCLACHQYILDELGLTPNSQAVRAAHKRAADNGSLVGNYTTLWLSMELDNSTDLDLCHLCHLAKVNFSKAETLFTTNKLSPSHTQTTIRMCTDIFCHGNNQTTRSYYPNVSNVGVNLGQVNNSHRRWFTALSDIQTSYVNETGAAYTKDYWACLGCHTEVGMKATFQNREAENFSHYDPDGTNATRRYI